MEKVEIVTKLNSLIRKTLRGKPLPAELSENLALRDDLGIDSLDAIEMVCEIEDSFSIRINDNEAAKLHKVGDVIDLITLLLGDSSESKQAEIGSNYSAPTI